MAGSYQQILERIELMLQGCCKVGSARDAVPRNSFFVGRWGGVAAPAPHKEDSFGGHPEVCSAMIYNPFVSAYQSHAPVRQACGKHHVQGVWGRATPPAGSATGTLWVLSPLA